jgi:hypothetical protein
LSRRVGFAPLFKSVSRRFPVLDTLLASPLELTHYFVTSSRICASFQIRIETFSRSRYAPRVATRTDNRSVTSSRPFHGDCRAVSRRLPVLDTLLTSSLELTHHFVTSSRICASFQIRIETFSRSRYAPRVATRTDNRSVTSSRICASFQIRIETFSRSRYAPRVATRADNMRKSGS